MCLEILDAQSRHESEKTKGPIFSHFFHGLNVQLLEIK